MVEHAVRLVVYRTRVGPIYPATHQASAGNTTNPNIPAMGQRIRLKAAFGIPATWTKQEQAVLRGLKKYGGIVADNGGFFSFSVTPDNRYPASAFDHLSSISLTNFEVVQATGPTDGPRSPNPPIADAGPDQTVRAGASVALNGSVTFSGTAPVIQWRMYSGPGPVTFGDATKTNSAATFTTPGVYTLLLSADDSLHAVAYSATTITVNPGLNAHIVHNGSALTIAWDGGTSPYLLEMSPVLPAIQWQTVTMTNATAVTIPLTGTAGFYRLRGN